MAGGPDSSVSLEVVARQPVSLLFYSIPVQVILLRQQFGPVCTAASSDQDVLCPGGLFSSIIFSVCDG